jgi:hypothetical protein
MVSARGILVGLIHQDRLSRRLRVFQGAAGSTEDLLFNQEPWIRTLCLDHFLFTWRAPT